MRQSQPLYSTYYFYNNIILINECTVPVSDASSSSGGDDDDDGKGNDGKGYDGNGNNNNSDGDDDFVELLQIFQDQYRSFMACFNYIYIYTKQGIRRPKYRISRMNLNNDI